MEYSRPKLWTRDFILMCFVNLFVAAGTFLLIPTLPLYARDVLQVGEAEIGYISGLFTLSALFLRPVSGYMLDSWGRKITFLSGLALTILCLPWYAFATSLSFLLALRFLHGLTWGVVTTGGSTVVSDIVPAARRGEGIGYYGMSFTLAMALGPVIGLSMYEELPFEFIIRMTVLGTIISLILATSIKYIQITPTPKPGKLTNNLYEARALPAASIAFICSAVYGGLISFMTLFMREANIQTGIQILDSGAIFFIAYAIGLTVIRPISGVEMDKNGPKRVISIGLSTLMLGLILLASTREVSTFLIASVVCGLGMGSILPTVITMVINVVEPSRRGLANATFFSAIDVGAGFGTIILGLIAESTSIRVMYYISSSLLLIPLIFFNLYILKDYYHKLARIQAQEV